MGCCLSLPWWASGAEAAPLLHLHRQAGAVLLSCCSLTAHSATWHRTLGSAERSFCERSIRSAWRLLREATSQRAQTARLWECMNRPGCCAACTFLGAAETAATPRTHPASSAPKCYTRYSCNPLYTCSRNWSSILCDPIYLSVLTAVTSSCLWNPLLSTYMHLCIELLQEIKFLIALFQENRFLIPL